MWQHLCSQNLWCLMWPDVFHKVSRKTSLAISTVPTGVNFMRRMSRLFRMLRGPWGQQRFGKTIAESKQHLIRWLDSGMTNYFWMWFRVSCVGVSSEHMIKGPGQSKLICSRKALGKPQERGEGDDLMEMYLAGCCRDAGRDIGDYGPSDLL